ncbi:hypothetical protein [Corynebacterium suedekumii]|uniref:Uncharacterized protein n=1 Tax=Corynebacterium suedekumii TaxID=3049801 RepID=A0ABY8VJK9_9CORY|nr:hypothetical protein [Corynebacterium suedekumii]WIM69552.1 hypothetical protein QP029_09885 [Corynebacterium suedekumii]
MTTIISWALVAFALISTVPSIRRAWRRSVSGRNMVTDLLATAILILAVGFIPTIWNGTVPVALWWLLAGLLGILAGVVTHRLLTGHRHEENGVGVGV